MFFGLGVLPDGNIVSIENFRPSVGSGAFVRIDPDTGSQSVLALRSFGGDEAMVIDGNGDILLASNLGVERIDPLSGDSPPPQGFLGHLIAREFSQEECRDGEARSGFGGGGGSP